MKASENYVREKPIPENKRELVEELAQKIKGCKTLLIASMKGLPGSQFNEIKKQMRGTADIKVAKKSIIYRAIDLTGKGSLQQLKEQIDSDFALFFSDLDAFELSGILSDSQSPAKAKTGDMAPEDIEIEPGPTDLMPGPAISELGSVGLKVAVKEGKLEIIKGAVIVRGGEEINDKVAGVLSKLGIAPLKVGFIPLAAYDAESDKVYIGIKINRKETIDLLRECIKKALGFAVSRGYPTKETISYFIAKASMEEKAIDRLGDKTNKLEENKEEVKEVSENEDTVTKEDA